MNLTSKTENGVLVLTPDTTRIDAASAVHIKDQFREATSDVDGRVVMDLTLVTFMDSSGLGAMVSALKLLRGRRLELAGLTPVVEKVFKLTQMDQVFIIHPDLQSAVSGNGANAA
ncbi:STAS domain-containing protein [uncultured Litoreibacter sp.]|uniref:STAS domain-containing protein n=1 Tax=uncultured Litoreibacter sp. TaxID=1392394 RepID=UPI00262AF768|nr:STAS domain-containing protein [uncultured Litoreibacter sp.]